MSLQFTHKPQNELEQGGRKTGPPAADTQPSVTCPNCRRQIPDREMEVSHKTCACGYHFRMSARERIAFIMDTFTELDGNIESTDILGFPGYPEKLKKAKAATGEADAVICGTGEIAGEKTCVFVMEPGFMMGSMGTVVGEKITRLFEFALQNSLPVVGFTVSGGARMQEGILSLMQMAKTSAAVRRHSDGGLLYICVLTDPTTGGVTASFAMEGDVILAEPGATVGFAGARVIEQTTRETLPEGFQTSEFLLDHGFVDAVVDRSVQRERLAFLLRLHGGKR